MSGELGELNFRVEYVSMMQINQSYDVDSYFRMHRGCHVTLYQDVKVPDNLPYFNMVRGPHDAPLQTHSCWRDLYDRCVSVLCFCGDYNGCLLLALWGRGTLSASRAGQSGLS